MINGSSDSIKYNLSLFTYSELKKSARFARVDKLNFSKLKIKQTAGKIENQ